MPFDPLAAPPYVTADLPGIGGCIKQELEDFEVEEIPAYEPCGTGGFLYLWIEKRDMGAEYFIRQVARRLGLPSGAIGSAGNKDRRAVTRQMLSVPEEVESRLEALNGDGMSLLKVNRHGNKLKSGHLHGNRFQILLRDVSADAHEKLGPLLARIQECGLANYYGSQRFGHDGETVLAGLAMLRKEPIPRSATGGHLNIRSPFLRKLALSSVQSALFNHYLGKRLTDGLFRTVIEGDALAKWPFGGLFVTQDVVTEQTRLDAREIIPAGPMFGRKTFQVSGLAAKREAEVLDDAGFTSSAFNGFGKLLQGTRRHNFVYLGDLTFVHEGQNVRLSFSLPAGSYATIFLREITKNTQDNSDEGA